MDGRLPLRKVWKISAFKYMGKSILSLCSAHHDSNLSACVDNKVRTIEFERVLGNRYLAFERLSLDKKIGLLDYSQNILKKGGVFCAEYDVGLFDWVTCTETVQMLQDFFHIKEIHHEDEVTSHHKAHAAGAFYSSGFDEALVISHDGGGNDGTFCAFNLDKNSPDFRQLNPFTENHFSTKYCMIARCISEIQPTGDSPLRHCLQRNSHEASATPWAHRRLNEVEQGVAGKLMGLAAYGSFDQNLFDLIIDYFRHPNPSPNPYNPLFWDSFGEMVRTGVKGQDAYNLAFNAQCAFEEHFLELFSKYFNPNEHQNVCLAGGGALNVVLNERLSKEYPGSNFFVPSSPGDSGLSYGMIAHYLQNGVVPEIMYMGCEVLDPNSLSDILMSRPWRKATPALIADELSKGKIIGVCRGNSETGPRALGNRSILADPRNHQAKDIINNKVKFREWYRPFAPVCKEESAHTFFETSRNVSYRYMSFSPPVRKEYQEVLPAVTHVDGSSRLQTISANQNQFLYNVLDEFEKITKIPVLVNTSFNTKGKAILTRYLTALQVLDSTGLDGVVLEDYYISK